jgi:hypothetical protein
MRLGLALLMIVGMMCPASPSLAAVAFDSLTGVGHTTDTGTTSVTNTNQTVGAGSQRMLAALLAIKGGTPPTSVVCNWDSTNQAMTLVPGSDYQNGTTTTYTAIYGLVAPTSRNKTQCTWTGTAVEAKLAAISFTGVDQTSVIVAFPHSAHGTSLTAVTLATTGALTSASGNMVMALFTQAVAYFSATSGTTIDLDTTASGDISMATLYDNGAATVTSTAAWGGSNADYSFASADIAAAGGGEPLPTPPSMLLLGVQ